MSAPSRIWWQRDEFGCDTFAILDPDTGWVCEYESHDIVEESPDALPVAAWTELVPRADREELREAIAAKFAGLDEIVVNGFTDAVLSVLADRGLVGGDPS